MIFPSPRPDTVLVHRSNLLDRHRRLKSLAPLALALSIQDFWRSRMKFEFGDHPSTVTKIGPATFVVENVGSSRHRDL